MPDHASSTDTELLEAFLQDDDLERLEDLAQEFNVFEVLDVVRQELRHSSFLAWLLDPNGNHGLGDYFLKRFLWRTAALARDRGMTTVSPIEVDTLDLADATVRREWRNIDILISSESQRGHVPSSGVKASASSSLMAVSNGNGETLGDHLLWLG
jgi:hypothetical protein